jgi:hypothetical protein
MKTKDQKYKEAVLRNVWNAALRIRERGSRHYMDTPTWQLHSQMGCRYGDDQFSELMLAFQYLPSLSCTKIRDLLNTKFGCNYQFPGDAVKTESVNTDMTDEEITAYIEERTMETYRCNDHIEPISQHHISTVRAMVKVWHRFGLELGLYRMFDGPNDDWEPVVIRADSNHLFVYARDTDNRDQLNAEVAAEAVEQLHAWRQLQYGAEDKRARAAGGLGVCMNCWFTSGSWGRLGAGPPGWNTDQYCYECCSTQ